MVDYQDAFSEEYASAVTPPERKKVALKKDTSATSTGGDEELYDVAKPRRIEIRAKISHDKNA